MPVNHVLLETIQLTQSAASVTFDNIPQTGYTDLVIKGSTRTNRSDAVNDFFKILPNGSSSSWTARFLQGTGSSSASYTQSVASNIAGETNGGLSTANIYGSFELYIPNYTSTNKYKSLFSASSMENNATVGISNMLTGLWSNTNAITSLTFTPGVGSNWLAYSTFSLYGIAATGTTPSIGPKAQGGNIVGNDGTYWYHAFLSSGTFTPTTSLTCDYLVVAGGGGGGATSGGGGGGGGFQTATSQSLTVQNYTVTIGAGGAGSTTNSAKGSTGSNSVFSSTTSSGGGGGGSASSATGANGGSGGGSHAINTAGTGTSGQGSNGGSGYTDAATYNSGGGGGGASSAGTGATTNKNGGAGGSGTANSYIGSSVTYAGGGGGGANGAVGGAGGAGGSGGGGTGASDNNSRTTPFGSSPGTAGTVNTGGGGGGGASNGYGDLFYGFAGGSGIVIIRYTMA